MPDGLSKDIPEDNACLETSEGMPLKLSLTSWTLYSSGLCSMVAKNLLIHSCHQTDHCIENEHIYGRRERPQVRVKPSMPMWHELRDWWLSEVSNKETWKGIYSHYLNNSKLTRMGLLKSTISRNMHNKPLNKILLLFSFNA